MTRTASKMSQQLLHQGHGENSFEDVDVAASSGNSENSFEDVEKLFDLLDLLGGPAK